MSKIGRKPINVSGMTIDIKGQDIHYKGAKSSGVYHLEPELHARVDQGSLYLTPSKDRATLSTKESATLNRVWGLSHALLANTLSGASQEFENNLEIHGLGYKAVLEGKKIVFSLGYSHKITEEIPEGMTVEIDKSGQKIKIKALNKMLLGQFCSDIKKLRKTEPYKGKGIKLQNEVVFRKAAKGKK